MLRLQEYYFTIGHVAGKENWLADFLSRLDEENKLCEIVYGVHAMGRDPLGLIHLQKWDPTLKAVKIAITEGTETNNSVGNKELKMLLTQKEHLRVNTYRMLTWLENDGSWLAVIPKCLGDKMMQECHQLSHTGVSRTADLRQSAYWPGIRDVAKHVLGCPHCQLMESDRYIRLPFQSVPVAAVGG
ncbi:unnamed protein product [Heterobilharzia americana]|nr:unnamed protein product [Heterobilharzia americana]CAH8438410.1 unnamed protein product [Heterobilharzia americana]